MIRIKNITCEHCTAPLAVTVQNPCFSWGLKSDRNQTYQNAYRIVVLDNREECVWDSGRRESAQSTDVSYEGELLLSDSRYRYQITVWDDQEVKCVSEWMYFETAFFVMEDWKANWIEPDPLPQLPQNPLECASRKWMDIVNSMMRGEPVQMISDEENLKSQELEPYDPPVRLRRQFQLKGQVKSARLYVTAHGIYEAKINGRNVTDTILNPGFTTYDKRIKYQVYPVEHILHAGQNAIAVTVSDGWYKGKIALGRGCEYGEVPGLLLQIEVKYEDGTAETICSDGTWQYSFDGPIRMADLFLGQTVDGRLEDGEPSDSSYCAKNWKPVQVKEKPGDGNEAGREFKGVLEAQTAPPAKVFEEIPAQKVWNAPNGDTLVDFGQNMAGTIRVIVRGDAGEQVTFEHGEVLDRDGNFTYVFEKDDTRAQRDCYICKGSGDEIFVPQFTYHGFRYVRVKGGNHWTKEQFTALAISTVNEVTGSFQCSDKQLNQLQHNIYWSQRSNNITIPTDCPTREKAGWTGDVVVYGPTALYNQDMTAFYEDWLRSIRVEQTENGHVLNTVPLIKNYIQQTAAGSIGWGDVILTLPMQLYTLRGDIQALKENYNAMEKWMRAIRASAYELPTANPMGGMSQEEFDAMSERRQDNQHYLINTGFHFGDWLVPSVKDANGFSDGPASSFLTMNYVDTAILADDADLFAQISDLLGYTEKAEEYRKFAQRVRDAFYEEYVDENGRLSQEMQGNYILALKYHMIPKDKESSLAKRLDELIHQNGDCLDTGFMTIAHILDVLCDYGYEETAWKILWQKKCPSWLYEIERGATTMWENWDAIREDGSICGCSFNHYAFGCVGDFIYRRILGIQNDGIGYDKIRIAPGYNCGLNWAEGSYESVHGVIRLRWEKKGSETFIECEIPANTRAILVLPDGTEKEIGNGKICEVY